ncbi:EthD family reductase [Paenibacillus filicis]|uniref:EthD family reductase n=1 Tax=Paenibacillus gyeongsangnamensis TaxID=3388067 RepID=A0ABT4Q442_9BACL|nr:EthD family reductase [Paenibacillus filicis]MCZ8511604.1 EthD family reductase [Paenibacillus filicis]
MAKMIVLYEQPKNQEAFEKYYFDVHIPLVQKIPKVRNVSTHRVTGSHNTNLKLYLVVEIEFENLDALNQGMATPEGQEVQGDSRNFIEFLHNPPVICIVE